MKVRIQLVIEGQDEAPEVVLDVARWERGRLCPQTLGLTLAEAKGLLEEIQQAVVAQQVQEYVAEQGYCPHCGRPRTRKGQHSIVFRTVFGRLTLESPRLYACRCGWSQTGKSSSPLADLLHERTAPELAYLETKFAALMSYGLTVEVLSEVLPVGHGVNVAAAHRQVQRVAERMEQDLGEEQPVFIDGCQRDWEGLPPPGPPLTVGLDGGYVHAKDQPSRTQGWFEVIAGKSVQAEGGAKCFAFVTGYDTKPKRRLFEVLKSQGLQMNQSLTFLTDGGDTVREVPLYLSPESEHWLDWFHITMRLTVMGQMARGLKDSATPPPAAEGEEAPAGPTSEVIAKTLESLKWNLWHGNVYRALQRVEDLEEAVEEQVECLNTMSTGNGKKLLKAAREFARYIEANQAFIPNYGDRYRHGETISTAFVESTVNQVVSKRMVKKQQMRWTPRGAHQLLQVRTRELNHELRATFSNWYPGMDPMPQQPLKEAA